MSMYSQFSTDKSLEKSGIDLDYGDFVITIARAGGANKRFARVLEEKMKPVRRAVQTETLADARAQQLLTEAYAQGVVLNWSVLVVADDKGKPLEPPELASAHRAKVGADAANTVLIKGIEAPDGGILPYSTENVVKTFKALPDLFADVRDQANKVALFREKELEDDAGN